MVALRIKYSNIESFVIIHTSCQLDTWVTRDYSGDAVHVGIIINDNGRSYYQKVKKLNIVNGTFKNITKLLIQLGKELRNVKIEGFKNNSIELSEYFGLNKKAFGFQKMIYKHRKEKKSTNLRINFSKPHYSHLGRLWNTVICNTDNLRYGETDVKLLSTHTEDFLKFSYVDIESITELDKEEKEDDKCRK